MRAAKINQDGKVVNYCEVETFDAEHIDPTGSNWGFRWDGSKFIPPDPNSDEEVDKHNFPLFAEIISLESGQGRAIREAVLNQSGAVARLQALDDKINGLRTKLKTKVPKV